MAMSIRILLADDHRIVRDGLKTLLEKQSDMEVVAEAEDGRTTVNLAKKLLPDIVIMDITMPDLNGIDATRKIVTELPNSKVIALSMHSDRRFVSGSLEAGASGYLMKDCAFEELVSAIRSVMSSNRTYLSPKVADIVVKNYVNKFSKTRTPSPPTLTNREREMLQLLAEGKTTKEIASGLHVSIKTVETHRRNIMSKLNSHSVADLIKYALREGLISLES
jgi:DNA-binding NarL/FixJ family response regulator